MKTFIAIICSLVATGVQAQGVPARLANAIKTLEADPQMKHAILSLYVADQQTGATVYAHNAGIGLPVASSQKVITSVAAFSLLGEKFQYNTTLGYTGAINNGTLSGNIVLRGGGDPSLGSWRYPSTRENVVMREWLASLDKAGIRHINGKVVCDGSNWETQTIPGGWIWDDIGNYYGAGVAPLNWRENQYDVHLRSGREGDTVTLTGIEPPLTQVQLTNELLAGKAGSGDNAYIYLPPYGHEGYIRGTIPPNQKSFTISGAFPDPMRQLAFTVAAAIRAHGVAIDSSATDEGANPATVISVHHSPALDSLTYWFLRKSINLYGEALLKTIALQATGKASTEAGVKTITTFWQSHGIEADAINIADGSGLSPQNRVTTHALTQVMQFARSQSWFPAFYNALPDFNGLKMKSGTIGGAKSFTGYAGRYSFAIVVNNFTGTTSAMVSKLYRVLDNLK